MIYSTILPFYSNEGDKPKYLYTIHAPIVVEPREIIFQSAGKDIKDISNNQESKATQEQLLPHQSEEETLGM